MTDALDEILALEAKGLFLQAHDRAMAALDGGPDAPDADKLRHRAVLALARAGASAAAIALFARFGLSDHRDMDIATLEGRLLKDLALAAAPAEQPALARRSAEVYERLWRRKQKSYRGGGYQGVNAAAMYLLAGAHARTRAIVDAVLRDAADDGSYWDAATLAEGHLLRGQADLARRWLETAEGRAGADFTARAVTRRQLRRAATLLGLDAGVVEALRIPAAAHFCGHMLPATTSDAGGDAGARALWEQALAAKIDATLDAHDVRFAYGGLAGGADLIFVEALLRRGAEVTIVLPFDLARYIERSVRPCGPDWVRRFEACLARTGAPIVLGLAHYPHDDLDFTLAGRYAMGQVLLRAQNLDGAALQIAAWDGAPARGGAGTAVDVATWGEAGGSTINLGCPWPRPAAAASTPAPQDAGRKRQPMSVLMSDLPRFGTLDDVGLGAFYAGPMVAVGRALDRFAPAYRNAWGDAVQLVFASPGAAAGCAFAMLEALAPKALAAAGLPETLVPRLALDFGAVLPVSDPVQQAAKFAGRVMTRAARIEPVTPPGQVYATEAFACEVALDAATAWRCEYAGRIPTAKGFGVLPLYAIAGRPVEAAEGATLRAP